jgi:hypothetical protein
MWNLFSSFGLATAVGLLMLCGFVFFDSFVISYSFWAFVVGQPLLLVDRSFALMESKTCMKEMLLWLWR